MIAFDPATPPSNAEMPQTLETVLMIVLGAAAVAWVGYSLWESATRRVVAPLYILMGSVLAIFYEPLGDIMEMAFYPPVDQTTWIEIFGRSVPVFVGLLFFLYFGGSIWAFTAMVRNTVTWRTWWLFFFGIVVLQSAAEMAILSIDPVWLYYGDQPFELFHFPVWIGFTCGVFQVAVGAAAYTIIHRTPQRHHWLLVPAVPAMFLAGHGASALPGAVALYNTTNDGLIWFGGALSMAVSIAITFAIGLAFVGRSASDVATGDRVGSDTTV